MYQLLFLKRGESDYQVIKNFPSRQKAWDYIKSIFDEVVYYKITEQ